MSQQGEREKNFVNPSIVNAVLCRELTLKRLGGGGLLDPHPNSKIAISQAKQITILPNNMTFRTDKDLEWKKVRGKKIHILAMSTQKENSKTNPKLFWPEKGLFFGASYVKMFGLFLTYLNYLSIYKYLLSEKYLLPLFTRIRLFRVFFSTIFRFIIHLL